MALGGERRDVLALVVLEALRLTLVGSLLGVAGAWALTRLLTSFLYAVRPTDPLTFLVVPVGLVAVAILASYIPARQAAKFDPMGSAEVRVKLRAGGSSLGFKETENWRLCRADSEFPVFIQTVLFQLLSQEPRTSYCG